MGKRGRKPGGQVELRWSPAFAYAIGLLGADGCLSKDGRHIDLTSAEKIQIETFKRCLRLRAPVRPKKSGGGRIAYHIQFSDVLFYRFLLEVGLTPAKSKTLAKLKIPKEFLREFVRGFFDGDGCSFSYFDPIFKNSFRFYISFTSASPSFLDWLREMIRGEIGISGHLGRNKNNPYVQLKYAKREAVILSAWMYQESAGCRLERKQLKIKRSLRIIGRRRGGGIGRHASFRS